MNEVLEFNNEYYYTVNEDCHFDIWQYDQHDDLWIGTVISEQVADLLILALEEAQEDGRI